MAIDNVGGVISGSISGSVSVSGSVSGLSSISGVIDMPSGDVPLYDGQYEVTPEAYSEIELETRGKRMGQNVLVHEIPYYETTNPSGGYTVIIG